MARKVTIELIDDCDGISVAAETVTFALDGASYEIDLSAANAAALREAFAPWIAKARKVGRTASTGAKQAAGRSPAPRNVRQIREWARTQGIDVSSRGRVSAEIVDAYLQATA
ncbi:histone-like nucleoid-structuring protein Lsr2 [Nocardia thailandica]|uniref:Lsr2 family protein n=1 Tax=Nocardia thailandica TaxID=257275 RepID=A0ABW6PV98_9NOCA|nr:Lsr2 family protein [Nocardia thailandica]